MTAALDFAMLPPEINSARMYSGAGAAPLVTAASAWKGLAAELRSAALSYGSVLSALTDEEWNGPASASMAAAAMPYVAWMNTTAVQAEEAATQAEAAAAAYETAFAGTVPPPLIAANRVQLAQLVSTNVIGQNTPAIAATEAQYSEMWSQDAAAMYGYAGSSAAATRLTPFTPPQQNTNPAGRAAQSAAVTQAAATSAGTGQNTLSQLISGTPTALQSMAAPSATGVLSDATGSGSSSWLWDNFGPNANIWNTIFSSGFYMPSNTIGPFLSLLGAQAAESAVGDAAGQAATSALGEAVAGPMSGIGGLGGAVSAGIGRAALVGPLSVPATWTGATPPGALSSALGATPMVAPPPAMAAGMPGVPLGGFGAQGFGRNVPQYGFKPTFVARPPAAG
jgi:PPE-repeat protein